MEKFSALLALGEANLQVTGEFSSKSARSFDVSFDMCLNKRFYINNREAGDLRRNRANYDVTAMYP